MSKMSKGDNGYTEHYKIVLLKGQHRAVKGKAATTPEAAKAEFDKEFNQKYCQEGL